MGLLWFVGDNQKFLHISFLLIFLFSGLIFLGEVSFAAPAVGFISPTPDNGATITTNLLRVNVSINSTNLTNVTWNFNGTNYSYYDTSLIRMYNFDNISAIGDTSNKAVDVSRSAQNLTLSGSVSYSSSRAIRGSSLDFTNGYFVVNSLGNPSLLTIEFWMSPDSFPNDYNCILRSGAAGSEGSPYLYIRRELRAFQVYDGTSQSYVSNTLSYQPKFVTFTYNSSSKKWNTYLNGVLDTANVTIESFILNTFKMFNDNWGQYYDGAIDELKFYNRILSASEISQHYKTFLNKYDTNNWTFFSNQTLQAGNYNYQAFASDPSFSGTEQRSVTVNPILPQIGFISPTLANATQTAHTYAEVNTSVNFTSETNKLLWHWNGTNYTIIDDSLRLMYNFDNIAAIGDSSSKAVDVSGWGINGTISGSAVYTSSWSARGSALDINHGDKKENSSNKSTRVIIIEENKQDGI